jgi:hypothetical protein
MTGPAYESFLARVYTDARFRHEYLAAPRETALRFGLSAHEAASLEEIDREGLELAARSFAHKRARMKRGVWKRLRTALGL